MYKHRRALLLLILALFTLLIHINRRKAVNAIARQVPHQIAALHHEATTRHKQLLSRQSATLSKATLTYQTRYGQEPPPGFNQWFEYAMQQRSPIIDDFDTIVKRVQPFREYQRQRCDLKEGIAPVKIAIGTMRVCLKNGTVEVSSAGSTRYEKVFREIVADFHKVIPDMCFDVNMLDEPRLLLPPEDSQPDLKTGQVKNACVSQLFTNLRKQNNFDLLTERCPKRFGEHDLATTGSSLLKSREEATNLCRQSTAPPHGLIHSPSHLQLSNITYPILSTASLSSTDDILIPSFWRYLRSHDALDDDSPWDRKRSQLYWRGPTTGGAARTADDWRAFHRQHTVMQANALHRRFPVDVRFSTLSSCDGVACTSERLHLPFGSAPLGGEYGSKLLLDMDEAGSSGIFHSLLRSGSAVLHQTIYEEWHDERLQPWLHYIPLSAQAGELGQILEYFFANPVSREGVERRRAAEGVLKAIADEGRAWTLRALRREDVKVYWYRLLLELARRD